MACVTAWCYGGLLLSVGLTAVVPATLMKASRSSTQGQDHRKARSCWGLAQIARDSYWMHVLARQLPWQPLHMVDAAYVDVKTRQFSGQCRYMACVTSVRCCR